MAHWKLKLSIGDIWHDDNVPVEEKGKQIAQRLKRVVPAAWLDWKSGSYDEELDDIVQRFDDVTGYDDVPAVEEFDDIMDQLYDWCAQEVEPFGQWPRHAMCWVDRTPPTPAEEA